MPCAIVNDEAHVLLLHCKIKYLIRVKRFKLLKLNMWNLQNWNIFQF